MASQNRITKLILAGLLITALTTATAAASIETAGGNDIVWQNSNVENQLTVQCGPEEGNITSVTVSDSEIYSSGESETSFSSDDLNVEGVSWSSSHEVALDCENRTESFSKNIDFASTSFIVDNDGSALLGERLEHGENSEPLELTLNAVGVNLNSEDISASSFSFNNYLAFEGGSASGNQFSVSESSGDDQDYDVTLNPFVEDYTTDSLDLVFEGSGELSGLERDIEVNPLIYRWSWNIQNRPNPELNYENVNEDYIYSIFMEDLIEESPNDHRADKDQFVLTVKERGDTWNSEYEVKESYEKLEIIEKEFPENSDNSNYRLKVGNSGPLDDLPAGTYQFELRFRYDGIDRTLLMDRVLVDKTSEFSGQVLDSGGNGVETAMTLNAVNSRLSQNLDTGPDGIFSTDINEDEFDINASFGSKPQSRISMSNVDLGSSTGPNTGLSSIGFEYWKDPETRINGLRPVNMMAVKFGYPIEDVRSLDMVFDSGELDPKDMKVYECNEWNFQGSECMGSWSQVPENDISIDYASWRVSVDNANLYSTDSGDILMNAYMVGTSSKISLQDSISLESSSIKHSGELGASGVLVSDNGDRVGDANVTLSLVQGDEVVESWSETSDSTGTFEFSETVDVEAGNYQLRIEALKSPYESFEMTSEKTLEVYYEKGVSLSAPTSIDVVQGNSSSLDLEVSNTGQQSIENIDLEVSGLEDKFYTVSSDVGSLGPEDSESVEIMLDLPGDYCNLPCGNPPQLDFSVTGESGDEEVSDNLMTSIVLSGEPSGDQSSDTSDQEETQDSSSETDDSGPESSSSPISGVREMTGDFVQKQGELNIALGLIFIFTMMLALSVKKKKSGGGDRRSLDDGRGGGRPSLQRPPINSGDVHEVEAKETEKEEESEAVSEEETESEESEDTEEAEGSEDAGEGFSCSVCGEEFESESGRDLHEEAVH